MPVKNGELTDADLAELEALILVTHQRSWRSMVRMAAIISTVAALLLGACIASAAPLPPPRPLTPDLLPGLWRYQWGNMGDGWILLKADGRYLSSHNPSINPNYAGTWEYKGGQFTLFEGCAHGDESEWCSEYRTQYTVTVTRSSAGGFEGVYGNTAVILSNPKR